MMPRAAGSAPIHSHPAQWRQDPGGPSAMAQPISHGRVTHSPSLEGPRPGSSVPAPRPHKRLQTIQVQGKTHWRDVSARFSFIANAMALPPSSYSRFAAKLEAGDRGHESHTQSLGQLQ